MAPLIISRAGLGSGILYFLNEFFLKDSASSPTPGNTIDPFRRSKARKIVRKYLKTQVWNELREKMFDQSQALNKDCMFL